MRKLILLIFSFFLILSCNQGLSVQLPQTGQFSASEVTDISSAYLFFDTDKKDSVLFNRKNLIGSTNWIIHTDKRLSLKQSVPYWLQLQEKRNRAGMHKNEKARNFFSASDSIQRELVFIDFTNTQFLIHDQFSKFYIKDHPKEYMDYFNLTVNFKGDGTVTIDGNEIEKSELGDFFNDFVSFASEGKNTLVHLNFEETLSFQQYISNLELVEQIEKKSVELSTKQFIYNYDALPDCNCRL